MQKRYASAKFNQGTLITLFAHANILIVIFVNYKDYPNEIIGYLNVQIKCIGYKFVLINFLISLRRMLLPHNCNYDYNILCCYDNKRLQKLKKEHCIQNQILTGILNLLIYRMYITSLVFSSYSQLGKKGLRLLISNYDLLNLFDITTQDITKTILIFLGTDFKMNI